MAQALYGFLPDRPGIYTVLRPSADSLKCDTLSIYYVRELFRAKVVDSSFRVYDDGTAFEWTWEGNGEEYDVLREGYRVAVVTEPYYRDTDVATGVQYCYNVIPYLNGCKGETSQTNCYTRVVADTSGTSDTNGIISVRQRMLTLYPNPAGQSLFLSDDGRCDGRPYCVTDVTGRIVLQGRYDAGGGIRVNGLAKGVYFLRMEEKYGKFVKD